MAPKKTALKIRKTRAKRGSVRRRAGAGEETHSLRPGLSFPVVAIGASAGGLAAFTELLKALPPKSGMAFVLIQHLEPKHESALTALLSKATSMPVVEVCEGMAVKPNCVYVIPPNRDMTIRKGTLRLAPRSAASGLQRPIDDFSIALAEEQGDAAIGVVLSGTGSDGTYGLKAIKAAVEREVSARNGHRYSMRVCPYKTRDNQIEGVLMVMLDVDLIYRARDEAQKSADYSRAIVETIHDALVVVDSEFRILSMNRSFCDLFHVSVQDMERQSLFGTGAGQCSDPQLRELLQDVLANGNEIKDFELDQDFPEIGRRRLVLSGRQIRMSGTILIAIEDVTERKRAQEALERSESTISALLDSTPQSVLGVNVSKEIVLINGSTERMFGYPRKELLGQPLEILIPERVRERHAEHHKAYFANAQSRPMGIGLDLEGRRKDGTYFPVEIALSAIDTAAGKLAVAFVSDITQRKRIEDALHQREHEISTVLDDNPDVILRLNRQGRYTYVNAKTASVAGVPREAFIGKTPGEVGLPPDLIDLWRPHTRRALETGQASVLDFSYPSPDGATEWEERFIPEFAPDGSVESILCIGRDVTERNRLQRITETDSEQIRALAARLLTAQEEERRRVSRELHDQICQQLASLAIDIGGLAAEAPTKFAQDRLKTLQARVVKASEETRHIAYELHSSVLDDLGLVPSLKDLCNKLSARNPDIALEFTGGTLPVPVPREVASCLYRVTQESLQNIAKHAGAKHVSVALTWLKGTAVLTVSDDGAGFDSKAAKGRGGIGLIGMEERARLVQGKLSITTRPSRGTRIALEVPLPGEGL